MKTFESLPSYINISSLSSEENYEHLGTQLHYSCIPAPSTSSESGYFITKKGDQEFRQDGGRELANEKANPYAKIFEEYPFFNGVQSTVFDTVVNKDDSLVVTAPTGSGKTVIFELAIVKLLINYGHDSSFKIIYMAPVKALCSERFIDWQSKFTPFGIRCALVTGDTDVDGNITDLTNLHNKDLVVTTPEKWDFLTRRWRDHQNLMDSIRLFLIDEVHLLNDKSRGHVLEAVVSRMKMIQHQQQATNRLRFIAVSATVKNTSDLAAWLGSMSEPASSYAFGEETRPVKLKKVVKGYDLQATGFRFELNLSYKIEAILKEYAEGKPSLIFCSTRKGVLQTAQVLSEMVTFRFKTEQEQHINAAAPHIVEAKLRDLVRRGIGYHHAGMPQEDRIAVETLFRNGHLPVLIATSTLAMGVNLPAHLVILKNTQFYNQGVYEEYSDNQILQMIGRAGRPQFDSSATAVIMTRPACVGRYERLVSGCDPVRSWLKNQIVEHLNAEIVLGSVRNLDDAVEWLKSTFYWVCAVKQPTKYGLPSNLKPGEIETRLHEMIHKELSALENFQLVKLVDNFETKQTPFGRIMARYYVSFDTMKLFLGISGRESLVQLLDLLTRCAELRDVTLRMHEKRPLNDLNRNPINGLRFPLPGKIVNKNMKINCLIQAVLGCRNLPEYSLVQDSLRTVRVCQRLSRCMYEVTAEKGLMSTQSAAAILAKCLRCQMWEDSPYVARQLPKIGVALSGLLVAAGVTTLDSLATANPRNLELILNRFPPMGDEVRNAAASIARLQVAIIRTGSDVLEIRVSRRMISSSAVGDDQHHWFVLIVGGSDDKLLLQKRFAASDVAVPVGDDISGSNAALSFNVYLKEPLPTKVHAFLISEHYVGVDSNSTLYLKEVPENDDDMFCDASVCTQDMFRTIKGPAAVQSTRKTPTQPRGSAAPKKIAATPAPRKTPAPKKTSAAVLKPPTETKPSAEISVSDIRRFFPSAKQPRITFKTAEVDAITEDDELPEPWRPSRSVFDEPQNYEDSLKDQAKQRTRTTSPAVKNIHQDDELPEPWRPSGRIFEEHRKYKDSSTQRTHSSSPAVKNIDGLAKTSVLDNPVGTDESPVTTNSEFESFLDKEDDRVIDCGFDAFIAEAIREAEAEKNDENRLPEEVEIIEGPEIVRPEPRCFGNNLTNVPSATNGRIHRTDSPRMVDKCNRSGSSCVRSLSDISDLDEVSVRRSETRSRMSGASGDNESTGDDMKSPWNDRAKSVAAVDLYQEELPGEDCDDSIMTIDLTVGLSPCSDTEKADAILGNSREYENIYEDHSDLISTTGQGDSLWKDQTRAHVVPRKSNEKLNQGCVPTIGQRMSPSIGRRKVAAVPTDLCGNERPVQENGDFVSTIDNSESLWTDTRKAANVPTNPIKSEKPDQEYCDIVSTKGDRKSSWAGTRKPDAVPTDPYAGENPGQEHGDYAEIIGHRGSLRTNRRKVAAVPTNSFDSQKPYQEYADFALTFGHRESPWIDGAKENAVRKNVPDYEKISEDQYGYSTPTVDHGNSPWMDEAKASILKNSYDCKESTKISRRDFTDSASIIEHRESPWMNRNELDARPRSIQEFRKATEVTLLRNFTPSIHHESPWNDRKLDPIIADSLYGDGKPFEDEYKDYTSSTIGHTHSPWLNTPEDSAFPGNPYVSFTPTSGQLESPWRERRNVRTVPGIGSKAHYPLGVEWGDPQSSIHGDSTPVDRSAVEVQLKSSRNKPDVVTIRDDAELNLLMSGGQKSKGCDGFERLQHKKAPQMSTKKTQKSETRPGTAKPEDIFPIIDGKVERGMTVREDNSWYDLHNEDSDWFVDADADWDRQSFQRCSFNDPRDVTEEVTICDMMSRSPLPKADVEGFNYDEPQQTGPWGRGFLQSCSPALSKDSGLSMNFRSETSQESIFGRQGGQAPVLPIIAELGFPPLPHLTRGTDSRGSASTSRRAEQAFNAFILRETSSQQFLSSQTTDVPSYPWDQNLSAGISLQSSLLRAPTGSEDQNSTPSYAPQPSRPSQRSAPRLYRLKNRSSPCHKFAHTDHVSSSFENLIASVKAKPSTKKRTLFGTERSDKKMRSVGKVTSVALVTQQNPRLAFVSPLQGESNVIPVRRTTDTSKVFQRNTDPPVSFEPVRETLTVTTKPVTLLIPGSSLQNEPDVNRTMDTSDMSQTDDNLTVRSQPERDNLNVTQTPVTLQNQESPPQNESNVSRKLDTSIDTFDKLSVETDNLTVPSQPERENLNGTQTPVTLQNPETPPQNESRVSRTIDTSNVSPCYHAERENLCFTSEPVTLQNPKRVLASATRNESNVSRTTHTSVESQQDANPTVHSDSKWQHLNVTPESNGEQPNLSTHPQLTEKDKIISRIDTHRVAPKISKPFFPPIRNSVFAQNVSENFASMSNQPLLTSRERTDLQKSKPSGFQSSPVFSTSSKRHSTDQSTERSSKMFPPSMISRGSVQKAQKQQKQLNKVFKSKPAQNMFVENINKISQVATSISNGAHTPRIRFRPPILKSQPTST